MKLKHLAAYKTDRTPDHILEEVSSFGLLLSELLMPHINKVHPNIALASFNFLHAALIKHLVVDDENELMKAALAECKALENNIKVLMKIQREKNERDST